LKKIIGISGWKRSGKDTFAKMIKNNHAQTRILSLAAPLKEACMLDYGLTVDECYGQEYKELPLQHFPCRITDSYAAHAFKGVAEECRDMDGNRGHDYRIVEQHVINNETGMPLYWTPRALMIFKGSNQRTLDPDYWLNRLSSTISESNEVIYLIPDLRYKNEASFMQKQFGDDFISVRVSGRVGTDSADPSERDLDDYGFDWRVENSGTLEELEVVAKSLLREI